MAQLRRDDVDRFFDFSLHVGTRTIFMGTEVDEEMVEFFLKGIHLLAPPDERSPDPIHIVMNNIGGDDYHGLAIYDALACSRAYSTITAFGHAMSMGSWIFQAADKRIMAPNATMMLHYGSWRSEGTVRDTREWNKEMERISILMEDCYLKRIREKKPRFTRAQLQRSLTSDLFLTAKDSVDWGLVDTILE